MTYGIYGNLAYVIPALILSMAAQFYVQMTFGRFSKIGSARGLTGAEAAKMILTRSGVTNVAVERVSGSLTDHFDPRVNVIRLSDSVYSSRSIAAIGVAAHETGHALQHNHGYAPISIRNALVPVANLGSTLSMPLILLGIFMGLAGLVYLGIIVFSGVLLFQVVTLPVEFNASKRALVLLTELGVLSLEENRGARKVLNAAALTYVAAVAVTLAQLLRFLSIAGGRNRD